MSCRFAAERDVMATRAAVCVACAGVTATCPASGRSVSLHVQGRPCPRRKYPSHDGIVRWLGIQWFGVPYPIRLWLWARHFRTQRWASFRLPGCGCMVWAKVLWSRVRSHRLVRTNLEPIHGNP